MNNMDRRGDQRFRANGQTIGDIVRRKREMDEGGICKLLMDQRVQQ